jgi:predicted CXXCH cytochrome family protein
VKINGFDHTRQAKFMLVGKHLDLAVHNRCQSCHRNDNPKAEQQRQWRTGRLCNDCHGPDDVHKSLNDDVYKGPNPNVCANCHTAAGWKPVIGREQKDLSAMQDRWRIAYSGRLWDPYNQNPLKGDYPIGGKNTFFVLTLVSDALVEARYLPTPQGASPTSPGSSEFFGNGNQILVNQNLIASLDLFRGSTAFRPKDFEARATPVFNVNYLKVWETGVVNIDQRRGTARTDYNFRSGETVSLQELFVGARLFRASRRFDFVSFRAGIQGFTSDFRGFIYADNQPGIKFFGNLANNRYQWSVAYFYLLEKDTNSKLNTFRPRHQHVGVVNIYRQDTIKLGYTSQFNFHFNLDLAGSNDPGGQFYDTNGFLVRPSALGAIRPHDVKSYYLGWTGDGHLGRLNLSHALYQVLGTDDFNPLANGYASINAQMAALELSVDFNWFRPKVFAFFASGDANPQDDRATGFDSIVDNVDFAGGGFSFFNRQAIGLPPSGVNITNRLSLVPNLRPDKNQGQANFVNPGLFLGGVGLDVDLTPKLKGSLNLNVLTFVATQPLILLLQQPAIGHYIGEDYALRLTYRPLLSNNIITNVAVSLLRPGSGLSDIGINYLLYSASAAVTLAY